MTFARLLVISASTLVLTSCAHDAIVAPMRGAPDMSKIKKCPPVSEKSKRCDIPVNPSNPHWIDPVTESEVGQELRFELVPGDVKFGVPGIWFYTEEGRASFPCNQSDDSRTIVCPNKGKPKGQYAFGLRLLDAKGRPVEYDPFVLNR